MESKIAYEDNEAVILLCLQVYAKEAILAAAYLLTEKYLTVINETESDHQIVIKSKDGNPVDSSIVESFVNNCLDEQLRIVLDKRTGKIRELIVKHAFKPLNIENELGQANAN